MTAMLRSEPSPHVALADLARRRRAELARLGRRRHALLVGAVLLAWSLVVAGDGRLDRALDHLPAAATMVLGSFVAGSTPQGGGAVAFPVFTKLLGVEAADARTFSLAIQAVGMGSASAAIALTGRAVDRRTLRLTVPAAIVGFGVGSVLFALVSPPGAYTKVVFTLVVVAAGAATWWSRRRPVVEHLAAAPLDGPAARLGVVLVAALGGVASALFGSGADVAVYLALTVVLGVRPGVGVATSVVTMAAVSLVGLGTALATGRLVVSAGASLSSDVFGMWLAAVPVVVLGAPLGSWFASRISSGGLTAFIVTLAAAELISTALFLSELRTDPALAVFGLVGLGATVAGVHRLVVWRDRLAVDRRPPGRSVRRLDLELAVAR